VQGGSSGKETLEKHEKLTAMFQLHFLIQRPSCNMLLLLYLEHARAKINLRTKTTHNE
jgi:hypothetical protein